MKVAILSESPADEAAVRIFIGALMGREPVRIEHRSLRSGGWPAVRNVIPVVMASLHYYSDADAFVVVADSNSSPILPDPLPAGNDGARCRLHQMRKTVQDTLGRLRPTPTRQRMMKTAVGIAVPAIEAWLLCGLDSAISEQAWLSALGSSSLPYTKSALKQRVYGTDRPSLEMETRHMVEHARRLAADIGVLERRFPIGFGSLAKDVRGWGD